MSDKSLAAGQQTQKLAALETHFGDHPCFSELTRTLVSWKPSYHWQLLNRTIVGLSWLKDSSDSEKVIDVMITSDKLHLRAKKSSLKRTVFVEYSAPSCVPQVQIRENSSADSSFDDSDLAALLDSNRKGVILAVSPHMHLSLDAHKIVASLAKQKHFELITLSDPDTPLSGRPRLESNYLIQRQLSLHYPSLLVFGSGKILSPVFPGLKTKADYEHFIEEYMHD